MLPWCRIGLAAVFSFGVRLTERKRQEKFVGSAVCNKFKFDNKNMGKGFGDNAEVFLPVLIANGNKDKRMITDDL